MADNVQIPLGLGIAVAAKDVGAEVQDFAFLTEQGTSLETTMSKEGLIMLRRLLKMYETRSVVDSSNRQRVNWDSLGSNTTVAMDMGTAANVYPLYNPDAGAADPSNLRFPNATPRYILANAAIFATLAGADRMMYIDLAKETVTNSLRPRLTFS